MNILDVAKFLPGKRGEIGVEFTFVLRDVTSLYDSEKHERVRHTVSQKHSPPHANTCSSSSQVPRAIPLLSTTTTKETHLSCLGLGRPSQGTQRHRAQEAFHCFSPSLLDHLVFSGCVRRYRGILGFICFSFCFNSRDCYRIFVLLQASRRYVFF